MDNLSKDGKNQSGPTSGDIFEAPQPSEEVGSYAKVQSIQPAESNREGQSYTPLNNAQQSDSNQDQAGNTPQAEPPPVYVEDKRKKYILIAAGMLFLLLFLSVIVLVIKNFFTSSSPPATKQVILTYWGLWEDKDVIQPLIDEYKAAHPNININYVKQEPKQYRERLQAALGRGEGPDIFRFHNTWVPMLKQNLSPLPKIIYSDEEFTKIFFPVASKDLKSDSNFYGIPLEIDGLFLFYNEDILKSANASVPTTWDDIQAAATNITVKENDRIITSAIALGTAENIEHFSDIIGLMMLQNGVNLSKSLFSCSDNQKIDCAAEVLAFYRSFAEQPKNTWDETQDNSLIAFAGGKVAMVFAPSWQIFFIKSLAPNLNFKTAPFPQLPCRQQPCPAVNWATYWVEGVSVTSQQQAQAWEFLKFLSSQDSMKKMYEVQVKKRLLFGEPYSRVDIAKTLEDNQYISPLIKMAPTMQSFYSASRTYDGDSGINTSVNNYLKDGVNSLSQGVSIESALKTMENGFQQVFSRYSQQNPAQ